MFCFLEAEVVMVTVVVVMMVMVMFKLGQPHNLIVKFFMVNVTTVMFKLGFAVDLGIIPHFTPRT